MNTQTTWTVAAAVLLAGPAMAAESRWGATLSGVTDEDHGRSIDADVAFAPSTSLQLSFGGGSTNSQSTAGRIEGNSLRAAVDLRGERLGVRAYARQWTSPMFDTDTLGARASANIGRLTLGIAGEARGFDVDYQSGGSNPQQATEHFKGTGFGGGLKFGHAGWTAHADAMFYQYDELSRYVENQSPAFTPSGAPAAPGPASGLRDTVASLPMGNGALAQVLPDLSQSVLAVAPGLTTSTVTLREGALDRLVSAGIERAFTRVSLRLEWTGARDAILSSTTDIYRAGLGYVFSEHVQVDVLAGVADSYAGTAGFGGISLALTL